MCTVQLDGGGALTSLARSQRAAFPREQMQCDNKNNKTHRHQQQQQLAITTTKTTTTTPTTTTPPHQHQCQHHQQHQASASPPDTIRPLAKVDPFVIDTHLLQTTAGVLRAVMHKLASTCSAQAVVCWRCGDCWWATRSALQIVLIRASLY